MRMPCIVPLMPSESRHRDAVRSYCKKATRYTASCHRPFRSHLNAAYSENKLHRQLDDSHVTARPSNLAKIRFSFEVGIRASKMRRIGGIEGLQPRLQFERLLDLELLE